MTCCDSFVQKQFATAYIGGVCKKVLKVVTTDPVTAVVTISYEDPSTKPPTPITGPVVPGPCTPSNTPPVKDYEVVVMCTPDGKQIVIQYDTSVVPAIAAAMVDTSTGAAWTGDITTLQPCGATAESDPVLMCDNGVQFLRHIVKKDGEPTGVKFDTDLAGALYTVTNESAITYGECAVAKGDPEISQAAGDNLGSLVPSDTYTFDASQAPCGVSCVFQVATDAGTFEVRGGTAVSTKTFGKPVTVQSVSVVSGDCTPADILITGNTN